MTFKEAYTSLKQLYKDMMFPKPRFTDDEELIHTRQWTLAEIDSLDVHFFSELLDVDEAAAPIEEEVYLGDIW